jgi:hypothetical protein
VALCPDVVSHIDGRFDCCDLLQRNVVHHGTERKASSAVNLSIQGNDRNHRESISRPFRRLKLQPCPVSSQAGAFILAASVVGLVSPICESTRREK